MNQHLIELLKTSSSIEWIRMVYVVLGLVTCVVTGELIRKQFHWSAEVTRKVVHISVGIIIFFAPLLFQAALIPMLLAVIAVASMFIAVKIGLLRGMHGTTRFSYGTVFYPFSFFVLIVLFWNNHPEIVSLSMLSLAIGDAAAAIVGESLKSVKSYHLTSDMKSIEGSVTMLIMTFLSLVVGMLVLGLQESQSIRYLVLTAAVASIIATAWEAISSKGFDNFSIPISVGFVLYYFFIPSLMQDVSQFIKGIALSILISLISYYTRVLTVSGSVATFLLASTIYGIGGWKWTFPILAFFLLSSALSKLWRSKKESFENIFEKSSTRDWAQVFANGGIAGLLVIIQYFFYETDFYPIYLGAITAVTADTWGTEIGVLIQGKTISISHFKLVEPGTNGGVSFGGLVGAAIGALVVAFSALAYVQSVFIILIVAIAGVIASLVDSFLGGTIQAQYKCNNCGKITEKRNHCNSKTILVKGKRWINNDAVNFVCALMGGLLSWFLVGQF